jgi:hypothetical protein
MMTRWRAFWMAGACAVALPALASEAPIPGETPRVGAPPPGVPLVADRHVPSTELGFAPGIGPAAGQTVSWRGEHFLVVDVTADDGGPTFSGGSRFAITTAGGRLDIGLKTIAPPSEHRIAAARD